MKTVTCKLNIEEILKNMIPYNQLPDTDSDKWLSLQDFDGEVWMPVPNFEGLYEVSCYGRIKSLSRNVRSGKGVKRTKEKIMRCPFGKNNYNHVLLYDNKRCKEYSIHRLVAMVFLPNEKELQFVNHKDENKRNNILSNLEWCTVKYNNNYGNIRDSQIKGMEKSGVLKPVIKMDKDGNVLKIFNSIHEAARDAQRDANNVWACCVGKYKTTGGYRYKYGNNC